MDITFEKDGGKKSIDFQGSVSALLEELKLNPETVLVARNGTIVQEDALLEDSDDILILDVISGG